MINSAHSYSVSQLFDTESNASYTIPRYQREYSWGKSQWDSLFDDLHENDPGYYLGSIICINQSKDTLHPILELVDGQQRLTTLSLLFAAIHHTLEIYRDELDDDQRSDLNNLKRKMVAKDGNNKVRLVLQSQNNNNGDYCAILGEIHIISEREVPLYAGNRLIYRAYRHFKNRIAKEVNDQSSQLNSALTLLRKINTACLVKIEVDSHASAYTLFESLNNRGVPLTAIDLIKNRLLTRLEDEGQGNIDRYYQSWTRLLGFLGDDYTIQERFFRHYYNAFREELRAIYAVPIATRSNLIKIYQALIRHDAEDFLERIIVAGESYSVFLLNGPFDLTDDLAKALKDLERIQGAPSHLLLLYLLVQRDQLELSDSHLTSIVQLLVRFFVRRNLTDTPPTRDLNRLFMDVVNNIREKRTNAVYRTIEDALVNASASDETFQQALSGAIYNENVGVTRFVLCALAERSMTLESRVDLWHMEGKQYLWTIEHVFPQGERIPKSWIDMIAGGDETRATEVQQTHVHQLGNLTLSAFNSALGNMSFEDKRDRKNRTGLFIGYKNNLALNEDLACATGWSVAQIEERTSKLIGQTINMFKLRGGEA